jgi:3-methylfumaryl-CoA hydratase
MNAAPNATADLASWIGRTEERQQRIAPEAVAALAATLDLPAAPALGEPLPPGWHWLFFNPCVRRSELGEDGHPKRGGFLPPIELPRRMWAGSRIAYKAPLPIGADATRVSRIQRLERKEGRSGALVFLTVQHTTLCGSSECIVEEQDIVYRGASSPGAAAAASSASPPENGTRANGRQVQQVATDPVLLFRYSALTFNGHRIHYDQQYAKEVEGYPGLVVHGPLTATLLQQFAGSVRPGRWLAQFDFRAQQPLFAGETISLEAVPDGADLLAMHARTPAGAVAMQASVRFDPK